MFEPLLSRPRGRVRSLLLAVLAPLALLGAAACSYLLILPLWSVIVLWPLGPARWVALFVTIAALMFLAFRCAKEVRSAWCEDRTIAVDLVAFGAGCVLWTLLAAFITIYL